MCAQFSDDSTSNVRVIYTFVSLTVWKVCSWTNVFVYGTMNRQFRKAFIKLLSLDRCVSFSITGNSSSNSHSSG